MLNLSALTEWPVIFPTPVTIASVEALRFQNRYLVRVHSTDGAEGVVTVNNRLEYLWPILQQIVAPYFVNRDARDLESLVEGVYTYKSAYKLAGIAFWSPVAYVELAILDMLGKVAGKSVSELCGPLLRPEIPIYLSSSRRDTTPEEEVAWLQARLEETGADAVKLKIGGRMSHNADAFPGRTGNLIPLARKTFGDAVTIYVDANGSYDAEHAIEVGALLADYGIALFEEPCPWQEYWQTKQVADTLAMPVAGGEQDSSLPLLAWMIRDRVVDVVQTDVMYNGGMFRLLRVARLAETAGLPVMPHSPKFGAEAAAVLHFGAIARNLGPYQEYSGAYKSPETWYAPTFTIHKGTVAVPTGPGLGVEYDPTIWDKADLFW
ncbi:MAG: mandelate racemase/muconate lactonizing enzyme family protein [Anaerolineae bacterium]|nr:mandelate racemase/muconate lactonizing enzyme family protein [Anaerolineae bacterium]